MKLYEVGVFKALETGDWRRANGGWDEVVVVVDKIGRLFLDGAWRETGGRKEDIWKVVEKKEKKGREGFCSGDSYQCIMEWRGCFEAVLCYTVLCWASSVCA